MIAVNVGPRTGEGPAAFLYHLPLGRASLLFLLLAGIIVGWSDVPELAIGAVFIEELSEIPPEHRACPVVFQISRVPRLLGGPSQRSERKRHAQVSVDARPLHRHHRRRHHHNHHHHRVKLIVCPVTVGEV